jgi:hypothetical protein
VEVHLDQAALRQLERREQPQAQEILFLAVAVEVAAGLLGHLGQRRELVAQVELVAVVLLVVVYMFTLRQPQLFLVLLALALLACRAAAAELADQFLLPQVAPPSMMHPQYRLPLGRAEQVETVLLSLRIRGKRCQHF